MIKINEKDADKIKQLSEQKTQVLYQLYEVLGNIRLEENEWWVESRNKYKLKKDTEYTVSKKEDKLFFKEI